MACGCQKGRTSGGTTAVSGTYRVMVNGRQVYESSSSTAADTVAARFSDATILKPGENA